MNLKFKNFPVLRIIERAKKGHSIAFLENRYVNIKTAQASGIDLEVFLNNLTKSSIYYYAEDLSEQITNREFSFLKTLKPYVNQDLSDSGIILSKNDFSLLYSIEYSEGQNNFHIIRFIEVNGAVFIVSVSSGFISTTDNKINANILGSYNHLNQLALNDNKEELEYYLSGQDIINVFEYVIFKKYAPIEVKQIVASKGSKSSQKKGAKNLKVNYIDSSWFRTIINTEGFRVKGHFALRACGKNRSERKLVWIKPYEKQGYTRDAKSLNQ